MSSSVFSAAASTLGYLYQLRYGLVEALRRLHGGSYEWTLAIEAADDVEIRDQSQTNLHQLKAVGRPLTDADPDLWKTLRIWATGITDGTFDPLTTIFHLVTTASISEGSVAELLTPDTESRNETAALNKLIKVTQTTSNRENAKAFEAFTKLSQDKQEQLVRSIVVISNAPAIDTTRDNIRNALRVGMRRDFLDAMLERLEGWWFEKSIQCLMGHKTDIPAEQLDAFLTELREQFSQDNLPIDRDIVGIEMPDQSLFSDRVFVRQAQLANVHERRIQRAVLDYLRAFTQRSRWAKLNLLQPDELEDYQRVLIEDWSITFDQVREELGDGATESEMAKAARSVLNWVESGTVPPIRSQCTEGFVKRGSLHILADSLDVGWHPEFTERLAASLQPTGTSSK